MGDAQKAEFDKNIRMFGAPVGPRMPLLNSAEVAQTWDSLAQALMKSDLSRNLRELAILTVARTWKADFEWYVHVNEALRHGIAPAIAESIRLGQAPDFANELERIVYCYATELQTNRRVCDETYDAAWKLLVGSPGTELEFAL